MTNIHKRFSLEEKKSSNVTTMLPEPKYLNNNINQIRRNNYDLEDTKDFMAYLNECDASIKEEIISASQKLARLKSFDTKYTISFDYSLDAINNHHTLIKDDKHLYGAKALFVYHHLNISIVTMTANKGTEDEEKIFSAMIYINKKDMMIFDIKKYHADIDNENIYYLLTHTVPTLSKYDNEFDIINSNEFNKEVTSLCYKGMYPLQFKTMIINKYGTLKPFVEEYPTIILTDFNVLKRIYKRLETENIYFPNGDLIEERSHFQEFFNNDFSNKTHKIDNNITMLQSNSKIYYKIYAEKDFTFYPQEYHMVDNTFSSFVYGFEDAICSIGTDLNKSELESKGFNFKALEDIGILNLHLPCEKHHFNKGDVVGYYSINNIEKTKKDTYLLTFKMLVSIYLDTLGSISLVEDHIENYAIRHDNIRYHYGRYAGKNIITGIRNNRLSITQYSLTHNNFELVILKLIEDASKKFNISNKFIPLQALLNFNVESRKGKYVRDSLISFSNENKIIKINNKNKTTSSIQIDGPIGLNYEYEQVSSLVNKKLEIVK